MIWSDRPFLVTQTTPTARRRRLPARLTLVALAAVAAGCQSQGNTEATHEVKGKVLLSSGKALTTGRVVFVPADGLRSEAAGDIQADGEFTLTTRSPNDGAIAGSYKVRIEPAPGKNARKGARPIYPLKYVDEDSSGLIATVRAEPNQLEPFLLK